VGVATLLGAVFVGVLRIPGVSDLAISLVSNGGQLAAAALAALGCAVAARRTSDHRRTAWWWLSAGCASWAAGQLVWSYYEVLLDRDVPFPSLADVGFVGFPVLAAIGLVIWLGTQGDQMAARGRDLMDGAIIAVSLLVLSWVTTLGSVVAEGGDSWFSLTLSLAYPIGDLVLATLVLLALARGRASERATLIALVLGLGGLASADSAYVYLTSLGAYSSADVVSSGWVFGFLYVAAAGLGVRADAAEQPKHALQQKTTVRRASALRVALPYVPLVAAGAALSVSMLRADSTEVVDLLLGLALVMVMLTRQLLAVIDNQRLLGELAVARDQLEHQALHDPLTGLANRVLFADRLDRALLQPDADVSVLFCDLDDFKLVNDAHGHEAGDQLLVLVAERLTECVRATDTVSRLGGDEFAILLEDSANALRVADRVVASTRDPIELDGRTVQTSISVGLARHRGRPVPRGDRRGTSAPVVKGSAVTTDLSAQAEREATAALLLRFADSAMYQAKGAGKGRAVLADVGADAG
jgi:diguanylate cyclase (GGDEF)-like protein